MYSKHKNNTGQRGKKHTKEREREREKGYKPHEAKEWMIAQGRLTYHLFVILLQQVKKDEEKAEARESEEALVKPLSKLFQVYITETKQKNRCRDRWKCF